VFTKGKWYSEEFKKEAVKQVTDRGYSVSEVKGMASIVVLALHHFTRLTKV
jgi:transposase-like protein